MGDVHAIKQEAPGRYAGLYCTTSWYYGKLLNIEFEWQFEFDFELNYIAISHAIPFSMRDFVQTVHGILAQLLPCCNSYPKKQRIRSLSV